MPPNVPASVLMTNLQLTGYSGSELHTLDIARALRERGSEVTVATLAAAWPLRHLFDDAGVRIVEFPEFDELAGSYELFFAQHHVVADAVACRDDVHYAKRAVSSLGPASLHEAIPQCASAEDVYVFVSEECREARRAELPSGAERLLVFPNYPHEDFLQLPARQYPEYPRRIAIVSNHPPQELIDATSMDYPIAFDVFGWNSIAHLADARTLAAYDAIIAIGRTCLDAFAGRIPLYCYDHFGGPGYIDPAVAPWHAATNFSGRSAPVRLSAEGICEGLSAGYAQAVAHVDELHDYAVAAHDFTSHFDELMVAVADAPHASPLSDGTNEHRCDLICHTLRSQILGSLGTAQIFYGREGAAESEERSIYVPYRYATRIDLDGAKLGIEKGQKILRFDPDTGPCECTLLHTHLDAYGATPQGSTTRFYSMDPCYRPSRALEADTTISFAATKLSAHDAARHSEELHEEVARARSEARSVAEERERLAADVAQRDQLLADERSRHESLRWTAKNLSRLVAERSQTAVRRLRR